MGVGGLILNYIYILCSISHPIQTCIGITSYLRKRLKAHNTGNSPHTSKYKPWKIVTYLAFVDNKKAHEFERYLKPG